MKKIQLKEYRTKTVKELKKEADKLKATLADISVKIASSKEKNLKVGKNIRKDLAQIMTLINEKNKNKEDK